MGEERSNAGDEAIKRIAAFNKDIIDNNKRTTGDILMSNLADALQAFGKYKQHAAGFIGAMFKNMTKSQIEIIEKPQAISTVQRYVASHNSNPYGTQLFTSRQRRHKRNKITPQEIRITIEHMTSLKKPILIVRSGASASVATGKLPHQHTNNYIDMHNEYCKQYPYIFQKLCQANPDKAWPTSPRGSGPYIGKILKTLRLHRNKHPHECGSCKEHDDNIEEMELLNSRKNVIVSATYNAAVLELQAKIDKGAAHKKKNINQRQFDMSFQKQADESVPHWGDADTLKINFDYGSYNEQFGLNRKAHLNCCTMVLQEFGVPPLNVDFIARTPHDNYMTTTALVYLFRYTDFVIDRATRKSKFKKIYIVGDNGMMANNILYTLSELCHKYDEIEYAAFVPMCAYHGYSRADSHIAVFKGLAKYEMNTGDYPITLEGVRLMFETIENTKAFVIHDRIDADYLDRAYYPKGMIKIDAIRDCGALIVKFKNGVNSYSESNCSIIVGKRDLQLGEVLSNTLVRQEDKWELRSLPKDFQWGGMSYHNLYKLESDKCHYCTQALSKVVYMTNNKKGIIHKCIDKQQPQQQQQQHEHQQQQKQQQQFVEEKNDNDNERGEKRQKLNGILAEDDPIFIEEISLLDSMYDESDDEDETEQKTVQPFLDMGFTIKPTAPTRNALKSFHIVYQFGSVEAPSFNFGVVKSKIIAKADFDMDELRAFRRDGEWQYSVAFGQGIRKMKLNPETYKPNGLMLNDWMILLPTKEEKCECYFCENLNEE